MIPLSQSPTQRPTITVVTDPSLGRERQASLLKTWAMLRKIADVTILPTKTTEFHLLDHLERHQPQLTLLPWQHYLSWSRIEGYYGLTRTSGPTIAGYFGGPTDRQEIGSVNLYHRLILLDLFSTSPIERLRLIHALLHDRLRSGLRPLVSSKALRYYESWKGNHPPGLTVDSLVSLPALREAPWKNRLPSIQLIALSLWNLAFEDGRALARSDWIKKIQSNRVRAYFELTLDHNILAFRVCYQQQPNSARSIIEDFWPDTLQAHTPFRRILEQNVDLLRIHPIAERSEIEIVVSLFKSGAKERPSSELRSLWIEPLAMHLVKEMPSAPEDEDSDSIPLPSMTMTGVDEQVIDLNRAQRQISWLEEQLDERDKQIKELLTGGLHQPSKKSA
ncbi:MAG: hypothetical protein RJB38_409 [Pseudomonadota bacterium]